MVMETETHTHLDMLEIVSTAQNSLVRVFIVSEKPRIFESVSSDRSIVI